MRRADRTRLSATLVEPALDYAPGTLVGEYRIEHVLGRGGMGTVYQAVHAVIEKRAALKILHRELCTSERVVARFVREARAVNRIGHPNIVDVFGFGATHDGREFLAMELLEGESLGDCIDRRCRSGVGLPLAEACHILSEIVLALEAAHRAGVVHRDLKPDNVFLLAGKKPPAIKLLDFGIAKLLENDNAGPLAVDQTMPGVVVGTPRYLAPEQARNLPIDGRADIYALGVLAFELFAGRAPFIGDDGLDVVAKHLALEPPKPSDFAAGLPRLVDEIVLAMLAKDPAGRPLLAQVREALARIPYEEVGDHARRERRLDATKIVEATPRRSRQWAIIAGVTVGAAGVAWYLMRQPEHGVQPSAPPSAAAERVPHEEPAFTAAPVLPRVVPQTARPVAADVPSPKKKKKAPRPAGTRETKKREAQPKPASAPTAPVDDDALRDPFEPNR